jgi:peptidoglycan pentaglycine glycine transferase (the first glycine)
VTAALHYTRLTSSVEVATAETECLEWDAYLAQHPLGHHEQSSWYARNRQTYGYECDRIIVRRGRSIVGGAQILVRGRWPARVAHIPRGPLADEDDPGVLHHMIEVLTALARTRTYRAIRVDGFLEAAHVRDGLCKAGFEASEVWGGSSRSERIPLSLGDNELLNRMHYNVRRYVTRLSRRDDVEVRAGDASTVPDFHTLLRKTAEYQRFPTFPSEYFEYLQTVFGRRTPHFIAYHRDRPVAAVVNPIVGRTMYYGWGGIDRDSIAGKQQINLLLHFWAAGWAREAGCEYYDLAGSSQFKRQLGIEPVMWPAPLRRYFGAGAGLVRRLVDLSWRRPGIRHLVTGAKRRFRLSQPMPR